MSGRNEGKNFVAKVLSWSDSGTLTDAHNNHPVILEEALENFDKIAAVELDSGFVDIQ